jgi:hypothetical protein
VLVPADNRRQLTVHSPQHIFLTFKPYFLVTGTKEDIHELKDISIKLQKAKIHSMPLGITNCNHRSEDIIPSLLLFHDRIGEHAAIPANMCQGLVVISSRISHPVTCIMGDIEQSIWIGSLAVTASFIV